MDAEHECADPARAAALPRVKPAITSSWRCFSFSLRQSRERRPGRYGESTSLATTPSRPWSRAARSRAAPSSNDGETRTPPTDASTSCSSTRAPLRVGTVDQRLAVALEHVEGDEHERAGALLQQPETGAAGLVQGADLAVEHGRRRADCQAERPGRGSEAGGEVVAVPASEGDAAAVDARQRPEPVPLRLERPAVPARQSIGRAREHRRIVPRLGACVLPQQEPVLLLPVEMGRHERPESVEPLAVESHGETAVSFSSTSS